MTIPPLPQGVSQFLGPNGAPLAGGTVTSFVPRTTFFKPLWGNPGQTGGILANPLTLDANGSAVLYGFGALRVVVKDDNGVTISDSLTFGGQVPSTTVVLGTPDSGVWTVPPGIYSLYVEAVGGGGGGANCIASAARSGVAASGGGAGGFASGQYTVTPGQPISYSVGVGGTSGMPGGTTNFGSFLSATGGQGGVFVDIHNSVGGAGGRGSGGAILNLSGGAGSDGCHSPASGSVVYYGSGNGGESFYGPGGTGVNGASGSNGVAPGSGGAGPSDVNLTNILYPGGVGAVGQILISYQGGN